MHVVVLSTYLGVYETNLNGAPLIHLCISQYYVDDHACLLIREKCNYIPCVLLKIADLFTAKYLWCELSYEFEVS